MPITHVFFDIGGVLGTNGWDREQRLRAAARFGLEPETEHRHHEVVGEWESGRLTLNEYLDTTIFYAPRPFSRDELIAFMLAESQPFPESIAIAQQIALGGRVRLFTLNNESTELNQHRIATFGLQSIFAGFLTSCWLGVRKPAPTIFERALGVAQAIPTQSLFIDDREQNIGPAQAMGFQVHRFTDAPSLARLVGDLGIV
jgi:putative hydrolase of the HAD superfamily